MPATLYRKIVRTESPPVSHDCSRELNGTDGLVSDNFCKQYGTALRADGTSNLEKVPISIDERVQLVAARIR